jgi:lysophospholipase L1-like esterase
VHLILTPDFWILTSTFAGHRALPAARFRSLWMAGWLLAAAALAGAAEPAAPVGGMPGILRDVRRMVFIGDSITQAGEYVTDLDCWLLSRGVRIEVLNLGLASETATNLTPEENQGHLRANGFGRPALSERLDRVLAATKPDLLVACYGMNDGASLPSDDAGLARFAEALTRLRAAALKAGCRRVVICTPPVADSGDSSRPGAHDENLTRMSAWVMAQAGAWDVVDIHGPMRRELDARRARQPGFRFSGDGVHPGREGHWLMAREILTQGFGADLGTAGCAEDFFPAHGAEIRRLAQERLNLLASAWLTRTGHTRPGVPGGPRAAPGPTVEATTLKAAEIAEKIRTLQAGAAKAEPGVVGEQYSGFRSQESECQRSMSIPGFVPFCAKRTCSVGSVSRWREEGV